MKKTLTILLSITITLGILLSACQTMTAIEEPEIAVDVSNVQSGCVTDYEVAVDYFPNKAQVEYAQGFRIEYYSNYKILTVLQPWSGAEEPFSYVLVQCGTPAPENTDGALVVEVPIQSIVTMSTTYYPHLENFGKMDTLVGVDDTTYAYNETVQALASEGKIAIVGGGAGGGAVNVEALLDLRPDVIMTSASGIPDYDSHPKLIEAGLPVVINADYLENTPLGRAEWGKFIAAFYNLEAEAETLFSEVASRYEALTALTDSVSEKPSVFTNTDFQGSWYVPGGQSYAALLLKDAGAAYFWADDSGTGSIPLSFEEVFDTAKEADFWLNVGFASDLSGLLAMDERYAEFKAFQTGNVFNYNKRANMNGGMDYFESGVANPDLILADLIAIFHPELLPEHEFVYYQQIQ